MAYSSATDSGLSGLDYGSRYEDSATVLGDSSYRGPSESVRAAQNAHADEQLQEYELRWSARESAKDPTSAASFALGYGNAVTNLASLAQSDPEKAAAEYDRLEKGIARYRSRLVEFAGSDARDPLSQVLSQSAASMLSYAHRERSVKLEDGSETTLGGMLGSDGRATQQMYSRVRGFGVFSDSVAKTYAGPDSFEKRALGVFIKPMLDKGYSAGMDPTRLQKADAAEFALENAGRLRDAFGEDGALRLLSGVQAMQGTAGGVTHLLDAFLAHGERQADAGATASDGFKRASRLLDTYAGITSDMFMSDGRTRQLTDSERRFAAFATIATMNSGSDLTRPSTRYAMKDLASLFAKSKAYGVDLFRTLKDSGADVADDAAGFVSAVESGLAPNGRIALVERYLNGLGSSIVGSDTAAAVPSDMTGDAEYYGTSTARLRGQASHVPMADAAARAIAAAEAQAVVPRIAAGRDAQAAMSRLLADTKSRAEFRADLVSRISAAMGLRGASGAEAAGFVADRYLESVLTRSGPFSVEQAVTDVIFSPEGSRATIAGMDNGFGQLRRWYRRSVVDESRYAKWSQELMAHLMSEVGGGYDWQHAQQLVATVRATADDRLMAGGDAAKPFADALSRGTVYVHDPNYMQDPVTGLVTKVDPKKDMPVSADDDRSYVRLMTDVDLREMGVNPKDPAFQRRQRALKTIYGRKQSQATARLRKMQAAQDLAQLQMMQPMG